MSRYSRSALVAFSALAASQNVAEGAVLRARVPPSSSAAAAAAPRQMGFLEQRGTARGGPVLGGSSNFEGDTDGLFGNMFENSAEQFRILDNLDPVAPMDSVSIGQEMENKHLGDFGEAGRPTEAGESRGRLDALYVPPYSRPDAFPRVEGDSCICGPASVLNPAGPQCIDGLGLTAVTAAECPDKPFKLQNCTAAKPGEICEADSDECGADTGLNNCKLWDVYRKAGVPSVALPGVPSSAQMPAWAQDMGLTHAKPSSLVLPVVCRCGKDLEELPPAVKAAISSTTTTTTPKPDWPQCSDGLRLFAIDPVDCPDKPYKLPDCESAKAGEVCEMDGNECGASSSLNNCKVWDVYRKGGASGLAAAPGPAVAGGAAGGAAASAAAAPAPAPTTTTSKPLHIEGTHAPENVPQMNQAFHYYRRIPVFNSSTSYEMRPADVTYSNGNYWFPRVVGGLVAPFDRLPISMYPLQAPADRAEMVPVAARGDRLAYRFARYIDQVEDRSKECDNVSPDCTTDCVPGDEVTMEMGGLRARAKVKNTHVGNMITVEFVPTAAQAVLSQPDKTVPECPASVGCSAFKVCYMAGMPCAAEEDKQYFDYSHNLHHNHTCPDGFKICGKVEECMVASYLKKDGLACRAAVPTTTQPPAAAAA